jgi:hypothetical protein
MARPPSVNLRLDVALLTEVRELSPQGELTKSINAAMQMWLNAQRAGPADAAPQLAPAPAPAAPASAPPRSSLPVMQLPGLPANALRVPGHS